MVYFCTRAASPQTQEETEQWGRVLAFRDELAKRGLTARYGAETDFERQLREHLGRFLRNRNPTHEEKPSSAVSPRAGPRVRFNLPAITASFTGRDAELDALDETFGVADRAVITQAITGLGGVGKSQLAARYVQRSASSYDVVAWIRAQDGGVADLAALALRLAQPVDGLSPGDRAQRALEWLSTTNQRWLLALDNVESPEQLDVLLPRGGNGRVLVTSRDRALRQYAPVLAVDVFDEDTATAYLVDRAGRAEDVQAARTLAGALGCLPLALTHAAAYCESGTTFSEYQQRLGALPARELFDSHPELSYAQTVASTWKTSIQAARTGAPCASQVLDMAAYLGPDAIPKTLFEVLVGGTAPAARHQLTLALNALARFSLMTIDDTAVSVHRLLQKTVRDELLAGDDRSAAHNALDGVDEAFPSLDETALPAWWLRCEELLPHALALVNTTPDPGDRGPQLVGVLNRVCRYLYYAGGGARAVEVSETAADHAERILGPEDPGTLTASANLAFSLRSAGHITDAILLGERVHNASHRILGPEHPDTLFARTDLAVSYRAAGRAKEAMKLQEQVLADREQILGPEHPDTLSARANLAGSYRDVGRTDEAIVIEEQVLADRERILGLEHPGTLRARANLAGFYHDASRAKEAMKLQEQVLADSERILGPEHPDTLTARANLAAFYRAAGRVAAAIKLGPRDAKRAARKPRRR